MNNLDIRDFIDENYSHFNAGELRNCVQSLDDFLNPREGIFPNIIA